MTRWGACKKSVQAVRKRVSPAIMTCRRGCDATMTSERTSSSVLSGGNCSVPACVRNCDDVGTQKKARSELIRVASVQEVACVWCIRMA